MTTKQIAGILMMILGFWLFLIPIYVGWKTYKNKPVFGLKGSSSDFVKIIFGLFSLIVPGILLLFSK